MMERRLSERRGELDQEKKLLRLERDEIQRTKNSIRREEESIKVCQAFKDDFFVKFQFRLDMLILYRIRQKAERHLKPLNGSSFELMKK